MNPPPRLAAALRAVERGWPVFPIYPYSKYPAVRDWPHRATRDLDQITRWWASAPYNIAIACQAAGLVVIDLDAGHDQPPPPQWAGLGVTHGRDVLRILAQRAGHPDPIDTYTVASPSGEHRYFLAPTDRELRNTTGATGTGLGWCIDTRAAGGLIIAAGSVCRIQGRLLRYRVVRDIDPVALPSWLVTALTPAPAPVRAPIPLPGPGRRLDAYVAAALAGETTAVAQAAPGTRAHTLFRSAARLGELVGARVLDETLAAHALLAAAPTSYSGANQFTRGEATGHITNGITRGRRNPRRLPTPHRASDLDGPHCGIPRLDTTDSAGANPCR
ncbi:MAG: bifunctional DNA primase/polymerase [Pseudonocardiaceae bacterium]